MTHYKSLLSLLSLSLVLTFTACKSETSTDKSAGQSGTVVAAGKADIGGSFELINQDGITTTDQDILGKPQLIYFGFSFCPDVCPTALQQMGYALSEVDPDGTYFRPIFISVDPERDTPESLKTYVSNNGFPKGLVGLTGSSEQVETAKAAYKIFSQKVADPDSAAGYTVDHVSLIFLMDKHGDFADVFTHSTTTDIMIKKLRAYKQAHSQ